MKTLMNSFNPESGADMKQNTICDIFITCSGRCCESESIQRLEKG